MTGRKSEAVTKPLLPEFAFGINDIVRFDQKSRLLTYFSVLLDPECLKILHHLSPPREIERSLLGLWVEAISPAAVTESWFSNIRTGFEAVYEPRSSIKMPSSCGVSYEQ